jgi:uncharacterized protein YecE (DUF72 family)
MDSMDLRIGCCGFPLSLSRYAKIFRVVEVQQTFYQPPLTRTLERGRARVPSEFEFTLKAWQLITHEATSPTSLKPGRSEPIFFLAARGILWQS